jgi:hypothetical protein
MTTCDCNENCNCNKKSMMGMHHGAMKSSAGPLGFFGVLAYIGAAIYFIGLTNGGFWVVVLAFLKAIIWPVYFVYNVLRVLGAA